MEEQKVQQAIERNAAEKGDAHWVLNAPIKATNSGTTVKPPLQVVQVGYAQIDSSIGPETTEAHDDGPKFRRFNMKKRVDTAPKACDSDLSH